MKIFLTGGTGFVGKEILKELLKLDCKITLLARNPDKIKYKSDKIKTIKADIFDDNLFEKEIESYDLIINLIGIIREQKKNNITFEKLHIKSVENIIKIAKISNAKKIIHMSANGARKNAKSKYHITKYKAEEIIRNSGINYLIFRPSVIYGPNDAFINMLNSFMKKTPIFTYFGKGNYKMQPVSVFEVAEIFAKSIFDENIINKTYSICGNKIITYKELLKLIIKTTNSKKILLPVPEIIITLSTTLLGNQNWFPLTKDQFIMLKEGNICQEKEIFDILEIESLDIEKVLKRYLK